MTPAEMAEHNRRARQHVAGCALCRGLAAMLAADDQRAQRRRARSAGARQTDLLFDQRQCGPAPATGGGEATKILRRTDSRPQPRAQGRELKPVSTKS
jgi:hypothetical protein